eukprot:scaffold6678_cov336-Prasinococcus_capsulatus_cf.AAC.2
MMIRAQDDLAASEGPAAAAQISRSFLLVVPSVPLPAAGHEARRPSRGIKAFRRRGAGPQSGVKGGSPLLHAPQLPGHWRVRQLRH